MIHPSVHIYLAYILSAKRPPLSWVMYPLRRNYSSSLIAIGTRIHANPSDIWVFQVSREEKKEITKTTSSTTKIHAYQFGFKQP